ncbi:MAG: transposase family protein [Thiothrix sp.]|nr:MAG: transposase family protein [Thiothrix sp.]
MCLTLSYWHEYCTFFHLGLNYGVHESNAYRVENRLAASGLLALVKLIAMANKTYETKGARPQTRSPLDHP